MQRGTFFCLIGVFAGIVSGLPTTSFPKDVRHLVFPVPKSILASGPPIQLAPDFRIETNHNSLRLTDAISRYTHVLGALRSPLPASPSGQQQLHSIQVLIVGDGDETVGLQTKYDYYFQLKEGSAVIKATSIYGSIYAMETFLQLLDTEGHNNVVHSYIEVEDAPQYSWRGLMIDSGRRFFPVPLIKNLLDTMAVAKLNVLHLHASDMCRFGVESFSYPNLTAALTGIHAGFYTQEDVKELIAYAGDRGIRVVPEFDIPGHSRGFLPIESEVEFCTTDATRSQLFGDAENKTYNALHKVLEEMAGLFTDEVFNIGCDETSAKGLCSVNSTFALERKVLSAIQHEFGKTPEGWEEVYFDAGAATASTIVNAWARHTAADVVATGHRAVESAASHFYFTESAPGGPTGWSKCWYDIATNVTPTALELVLGGEMSMWSDTYCYERQCGASSGAAPVAAALFDPARDLEFARSIGGMIWPRGYVAAASFWNYDAALDPASPEYTAAVYKLNDLIESRGGFVCPTNCTCDQLTACGKPYLPTGTV